MATIMPNHKGIKEIHMDFVELKKINVLDCISVSVRYTNVQSIAHIPLEIGFELGTKRK